MTLKQILQKICEDYGYRIKALEVMPDHIHIFVDVPQSLPAMWLEHSKVKVRLNYLRHIQH